ncbi:hypothetical protein [Pyruvatibacter mobilis]|uniref:hypothetical protein n=1 Tax=Pyruvatibacter mobilis TaxID=1712261 RepID=UPI003BAFA7E7
MTTLDVKTLAAVTAAQGLKGLEPVMVTRDPPAGIDHADLIELIMKDGKAQGWLWCSLSGQHFFSEGLGYVPEGRILAGEVALSKDVGLVISRTGEDGLSVVQWREGEAPAAIPALAQTLTIMNRPEAPGAFSYRRYWQDTSGGLMRQTGARFIGFDFGGEEK